MLRFYHITNEWQELPWFSTGGTRAKRFMQSADGKYYYFKRSQFKSPSLTKPGKDFKYEFWSEIIAHEIGKALGFNVLEYAIAFDDKNMGCISESMINSEKEHLVQGIQFLQAYNPEYEPENKAHRSLYTFEAIENALKQFQLQGFMQDILEMIVFDALIGNGDRHQENWGFIVDYDAVSKALERLTPFASPEGEIITLDNIHHKEPIRFAPIYDNGSSLGRELVDTRVNELLNSSKSLTSYVNKGVAEIHWRGKKLSHFELIKNLSKAQYKNIVNNVIGRIVSKFDEALIEEMVNRIDIWVPEFLRAHKIPYPRKRLIFQIIKARFAILKDLING
jgi:hypothetical protein